MDSAELKSKQLETWTFVVPGWKKHDARLVELTAPVTERMLSDVTAGEHVLDIASGTGEPALAAAKRVGASGRVLGTDFVEQMLIFAREKASCQRLENIEFRHVDGELIDVPAGCFDLVTICWGLMFMPNPEACLTRARSALKRGGRIVVACWASPDKNPWFTIPMSVLKRYVEVPTPPPGAPGVFAFADRARLAATLEKVGFTDVTVESFEFLMSDWSKATDYFRFTVDLAGPVVTLFSQLDKTTQEKVEQEVIREVGPSGGPVRLKGLTWIATGHA